MTLTSPNIEPSEPKYCAATESGCKACETLASMTVQATLEDGGLSPSRARITKENILPAVIEATDVAFPARIVKSDEFMGQVSCGDRTEVVVSIARQIATNPPHKSD